MLMARANLQRQIQAAAREAWMREFREQVALFLTWKLELHQTGRERALVELDTVSQAEKLAT